MNHSVFQKLSGNEKFYGYAGGREYLDFPPKIFCLRVPNNFVGKPFSVSVISDIEKIFCLRRLSHDFLSKNFCLTVPKLFVGKRFCALVQKSSGRKKDYN